MREMGREFFRAIEEERRKREEGNGNLTSICLSGPLKP